MMAVDAPRVDGDSVVLPQLDDRVLNNSMGVVHGGVASMGLELVASAAVNAGAATMPLRTASLRVNFLRQFLGGAESHDVGTACTSVAAAASPTHRRSATTARWRSSPG